ncbi:hypothetical protein BJV82DRAFT_309190 [Fennellomyces sp. T-0311]|nr:hypothetical protein BJV82DRAFT_309190 [Fennellomyces sp. T-0311]
MNFEPPEIVIPHGHDEVPNEALIEPWETMPLGKAVHTLLHVKEEALHQAVVKPTRDSPIARALYSIDNYLDSLRFADVYDALKDQFLKPKSAQAAAALRLARYLLLNSRHQQSFHHFLKTQELQSDDKRRHLAAVLLLEQAADSVAEFVPDLIQLAKQYGDKPVLIACLACDTVLACSRKALKPKPSTKQEKNSAIQIIEESDENWDGIDVTWGYVQSVLSIMKKWYPFDPIALSAWNELDTFITGARKAIGDSELYLQINKGWDSASAVITSKNIVSKKPLSSKKQMACLQQTDDPVLRYLSFIVVGALQKSQWLNSGKELLSLEENDIKEHVCACFDALMTQQLPAPFDTCGETIVAQAVLYAPHLVSLERLSGRIIEIVVQAALQENIPLDKLPRSVQWSKESLHVLLSRVNSLDERAGDTLIGVVGDVEADPSVDGVDFSRSSIGYGVCQ